MPRTSSQKNNSEYFYDIKMCTGLLPRVKRPTLSSADVKERVELYRYSPSGHSWPALG